MKARIPQSIVNSVSKEYSVRHSFLVLCPLLVFANSFTLSAQSIDWDDFQGDLSEREYTNNLKQYRVTLPNNQISFELEHLATSSGLFAYSDWVVERWPNLGTGQPVISPQNEASANAANDVAFTSFGYYGEDGAGPVTLPTNGDYVSYKLKISFTTAVNGLHFDINSINAIIKSSGFNSLDIVTVGGSLGGVFGNTPSFTPLDGASSAFIISGDTLTGDFNHPLVIDPPDPGTHVTNSGSVGVFLGHTVDTVEIRIKNVATRPDAANFSPGFLASNGGVLQTWSVSLGNLSFITVPEPSHAALISFAGMVSFFRRRR